MALGQQHRRLPRATRRHAHRGRGAAGVLLHRAVYGEPTDLPLTEDSPTIPVNTYGATKLAVDNAIGSYTRAGSLGAVSLRYFNVAGAHTNPDGTMIGERHTPETHLIPLALDAAARGTTFTLFGDDYPTVDGTCVRDYIGLAIGNDDLHRLSPSAQTPSLSAPEPPNCHGRRSHQHETANSPEPDGRGMCRTL